MSNQRDGIISHFDEMLRPLNQYGKANPEVLGIFDRAGTPGQNYRQEVREVVSKLTKCKQADIPLVNHFGPGVYVRERKAKAGVMIVGRMHRFDHLNIISEGEVDVITAGEATITYKAPAVFKAQAWSQKTILVRKDVTWLTVHATEETDPDKMEDLLTVDGFEPPKELQ